MIQALLLVNVFKLKGVQVLIIKIFRVFLIIIVAFIIVIYSDFQLAISNDKISENVNSESISVCSIINNKKEENNYIKNNLGDAVLIKPKNVSYKDTFEQAIQEKECILENINLNNKVIDFLNFNERNKKCKQHKKLKLNQANFQKAELRYACLDNSYIRSANFNNAILSEANFIGSSLERSTFNGDGTSLQGAIFNHAKLSKAEFKKSHLNDAKFRHAHLTEVDFTNADLTRADLSYADLSNAILSGATLKNAKLIGAKLIGTKIINTDFSGAFLDGVTFEPNIDPSNPPILRSLNNARDLVKLKYNQDPSALYILKDAFRKSGFINSAKIINCSIKRNIRHRKNYSFIDNIKRIFEWFFLDIPNGYGAYPIKPLWIIIILIFFFSLFYSYNLITKSGNKSGIWMIEYDFYSHNNEEAKTIKILINKNLLNLSPFKSNTWKKILNTLDIISFGWLRKFYKLLKKLISLLIKKVIEVIEIKNPLIKEIISNPHQASVAFLFGTYFSFISAFKIGIGDFEISDWIAITQPKNVVFKATGIIRVISGIQSVISAYLLFLWLLFMVRDIFSIN